MDSFQMNWQTDPDTAEAAKRFPLERISIKREQYPGRKFNIASWSRRILPPPQWPNGSALFCSPMHIIDLFQKGAVLEALAMVVSWGGMQRQSKNIYDNRELKDIRQNLQECSESIQKTQSIQAAWGFLTDRKHKLGWSAVMASKTLHFLSRACGFHQQPPVAIDNKVILNCLWPRFIKDIPQRDRPENWQGNTFAAYSRYMTAILAWAAQKQWTTTELEATIFADNYPFAGC